PTEVQPEQTEEGLDGHGEQRTHREPERRTDHTHDERFSENRTGDLSTAGPDGAQQGELTTTLSDQDAEGVDDEEGTDEERNPGEDEQERGDEAQRLLQRVLVAIGQRLAGQGLVGLGR